MIHNAIAAVGSPCSASTGTPINWPSLPKGGSANGGATRVPKGREKSMNTSMRDEVDDGHQNLGMYRVWLQWIQWR